MEQSLLSLFPVFRHGDFFCPETLKNFSFFQKNFLFPTISDMKWQGSERTLGIVKSEGRENYFPNAYIFIVFSAKLSGKQMFQSLINHINNSSTKRKGFYHDCCRRFQQP